MLERREEHKQKYLHGADTGGQVLNSAVCQCARENHRRPAGIRGSLGDHGIGRKNRGNKIISGQWLTPRRSQATVRLAQNWSETQHVATGDKVTAGKSILRNNGGVLDLSSGKEKL